MTDKMDNKMTDNLGLEMNNVKLSKFQATIISDTIKHQIEKYKKEDFGSSIFTKKLYIETLQGIVNQMNKVIED
jgi:hypothetical protein